MVGTKCGDNPGQDRGLDIPLGWEPGEAPSPGYRQDRIPTLVKFPSGEEETTPLSSTPSKQGCTSRTHFHSLQTRATPPQCRVLPAAPSEWADPQLHGSLTVIGRASLPENGVGEGKKEEKPILFPREKRLLTAVRRKAEARAHVI